MYSKLCLEILRYFTSRMCVEHRLCTRYEDRKEIPEMNVAQSLFSRSLWSPGGKHHQGEDLDIIAGAPVSRDKGIERAMLRRGSSSGKLLGYGMEDGFEGGERGGPCLSWGKKEMVATLDSPGSSRSLCQDYT